MLRPVPKPAPKEKKPRKPLRAKTQLKSNSKNVKSKPKPRSKTRHNSDPFPQKIKKQIYKEQGGICAHPGCREEIREYHHIIYKGMGGSRAPWRHDRRNGVGLCTMDHKPRIHMGHKDSEYWRRYWEREAVKQFGWLAGQAITLEEWEERSGFNCLKSV